MSKTVRFGTMLNTRSAVSFDVCPRRLTLLCSFIAVLCSGTFAIAVSYCRFGAGGHPKAAAASIRLHSDDPEAEARTLIDGLVDTMCNEQVGKGKRL